MNDTTLSRDFFSLSLEDDKRRVNLLLLQVILTRTTGLAAGEGAFMISFACMNANMPSEMA